MSMLPPGFRRFRSLSELRKAERELSREWRSQQAFEEALLAAPPPGGVGGWCAACAAPTRFDLAAVSAAGWREAVHCPACGLINRWRASLHLFEACFEGRSDAPIYLTEQVTPLYAAFSARYPNALGSEYAGPDIPSGTQVPFHHLTVRHEDATALSFADGSLAAVASFDVLEHIPDWRAALAEFARVLARGGLLLLTAPFRMQEAATLVRARLRADGSIEHLLEPCYHGDPVNGGGVLCFQEFGWDLADELRRAGFASVEVLSGWSAEYGYYGSFQSFFVARKRGRLPAAMAREDAPPPRLGERIVQAAEAFADGPAGRAAAVLVGALSPSAWARRWQDAFGDEPAAAVPAPAAAPPAPQAADPEPAAPAAAGVEVLTAATGAAVAAAAAPESADAARSDYQRRVEAEIAFFEDMPQVHDLPAIFHYWSHTCLLPRFAAHGYQHPMDFFARELEARRRRLGQPLRVVSVGAGNGEIELMVAGLLRERGVDGVRIECLDINPAMLERCAQAAQAAGLHEVVLPLQGDFNRWQPDGQYDVVMANQALHHVVELEALFDAIGRAIGREGVFLVSDTIGRNGHLHWPEALVQIQALWRELPDSKKRNHLLSRVEPEFIDWDCSTEGFEGVRAQDILPLLVERFQFELFVPWGNVIDPFIDRAFGPNYSPDDPADRAFIDRVHALDDAGIREGRWTPVHMIAVMQLGPVSQPRRWQGLEPAACVRKPDWPARV